MKLQYKIMLFFSIVLMLIIGGLSFFIFRHMTNSLETQMGNNAMDIAVTVASIDDVQKALAYKYDYDTVQAYIESFRDKTRFQYIIVMDMKGIQYSYPYEVGLGKKYKNGGEERVLSAGESYVSADRNILISAIRAFTPVYYEGEQVGAILVGLLTDQVAKENEANRHKLQGTIIIGLFIGIMGASLLAYNIKESIFGLEPKEIAVLLGQRDIILQSIVRSIIAVDKDGKIILYNDTAGKMLRLPDNAMGTNINDYSSSFTQMLKMAFEERHNAYNKEIRISSDVTVLSSYCLMKNRKNDVIGLVVSFEDLTEAKKMAEELTGYRSMINALRAQNHEFMNRLHTISGLIQLKEYDEAITYIDQVSQDRAMISGTISNKIKNTHVAAILLAKYNKLKEAKIKLVIDINSNLCADFQGIREDELCSIVGNLIDNSEEALRGQKDGRVKILLNCTHKDIHIVVENNGPSIPKALEYRVFERGITTKTNGRGFGLSIIKQIIDHAGGTIQLINDKVVKWDVIIPIKCTIEDENCMSKHD